MHTAVQHIEAISGQMLDYLKVSSDLTTTTQVLVQVALTLLH